MRRRLAHALHRLAVRVWDDECIETIEVIDEYGVCRCRVEVRGNDFHGVGMAYELLPQGWTLGEQNVGRSDTYRHQYGSD